MYRHHPLHTRVRELVAAGEIGEPAFVRATFSFAMDAERREQGRASQSRARRRRAHGHRLLHPERRPFPVRRRADRGHRAPALRPVARRRHVVRGGGPVPRGSPGADRRQLRCPAGRSGTRSSASVGRSSSIRRSSRGRTRRRSPSIRGGERHVVEVPGADQYALEADHFVQSVRAGRLLPPAEDGRAQARAIEALYRSAETGQAVRL